MKKPLSVDIPYPIIEDIEINKNSVTRLSFLYAGKHGELNAILQYTYQYFYFQNLGDKETAETLMAIAFSEMQHLEILGSALLKAGIDPIYAGYLPFGCNFYKTDSVSYSKNAEKMLLDDISGELVAIDAYEKAIIAVDDEKIKAILLRIKIDDELHVRVLRERLNFYVAERTIV